MAYRRGNSRCNCVACKRNRERQTEAPIHEVRGRVPYLDGDSTKSTAPVNTQRTVEKHLTAVAALLAIHQMVMNPEGTTAVIEGAARLMSRAKEGRNISEDVFQYMKEHAGEPVAIKSIVEATGLTRQQVLNGFTTLKARNVKGMESIVSGQVMQYNGQVSVLGVPSRELYEEIGRGANGIIVLQDGEGKLYRAVELS